ncbi:unnamed protein product [Tilletia controversa]|nr:unnamed protein product [Tilletia controversa]
MAPIREHNRAALALKATYGSMAEFKNAVTDYSLAHQFPHKWAASKKDWAIAVCQRSSTTCNFRVRAKYNNKLERFQVTVFQEGHTCAGLGDPKRAKHNDHKYLVELVRNNITVDHSTKDAQIVSHLKQVHGITVPQQSANKARLAILGSRQEDQLADLFIEALQHSRKLNCTPASGNTGLVRGSTGKEYNVKLAADPLTSLSSCSCGVPQLMLLPCAHICALAASLKKAAVLYAHSYWSTKHWRATYQKAYIVAELDNLDANELDAPETSTRQKKGRPQKQRREAGKGGSSTREPVAAFCSRSSEQPHHASKASSTFITTTTTSTHPSIHSTQPSPPRSPSHPPHFNKQTTIIMADWDNVTVIGSKARPAGAGGAKVGPTAYERAKEVGAITDNDRKVAAGTNKGHAPVDHQRIAKLDRENEVAPPPKVAPSVGRAIQQARMAKELTQKDLGTKINEKPQVIAEYESGKAVPNAQILSKMERMLGVKLRGKDIGAPFGPPSKK